MRLVVSLLVCSLLLAGTSAAVPTEVEARRRRLKQKAEQDKIAGDPRGAIRQSRIIESQRIDEIEGVTVRADYDRNRRLVDVKAGNFYPEDVQAKRTLKVNKDDLQFWERLLQVDANPGTSLSVATAPPSPAPVASPIPPSVPAPIPAPTGPNAPPIGGLPLPTSEVVTPTAAPVMPPTVAPTLAPTPAPVPSNPNAPPIAGIPVNTAAPAGVTSPTSAGAIAPTAAPVSAPAGALELPTAAPTVAAAPVASPTAVTTPSATPTSVAPVATPTSVAPVATPTSVAPVATPTASPVAVAPAPAAPASRVEQVVLSVALSNGAEFVNPESYQSKALAWLEGSNTDGLSDQRIIQRYSLGCIFFATNGVRTQFTDQAFGENVILNWQNVSGWATNTNECEWKGIGCDSTNSVNLLDLFSNRLTGEFPPELTLLSRSLVVFDVGLNFFFAEGNNFNTVLGSLSLLTDLRFDRTNMINNEGIPTEIGLLKNLEIFNCASTLYRGALNAAAFQPDQTRWTYMEIESNAFNSSLPSSIGNLPALEQLFARDSFIEGTIDTLVNMRNALVIWVDQNPGLGGTIPIQFGSFSNLRSLSLTECAFTGTLPPQLGNLGNDFSQFFIYRNQMTGGVPDSWANLGGLEFLELWENDFTVQIPAGVCALTFSSLERLIADCSICPTTPCCDSCVEDV
ncbi:predicted protein [Phaeodactylum tricornutum CCAP 1055/1]|uniref:Leucine-rich repeat-containing N-terminal plant-type domain-containing protein n=1 Tax=Phaeodactylum tricornutum (strain CCAP 1055/1) TaxID=556484 RepID=B7FYI1_PHATC|nr:predicted protein [Phaeodactylum tricornutum CCAP 1055/1]EEC48729.1 predicted protein [Phaeodactylum tricornutum CCAP 1055/1]|eukprot:XP_002179743.1 predicted protein [Phaeodactylum tricornutum CCAP 1055/1]